MPKIIPHKSLVYTEKLRAEIGNLVSPPYDVISPEFFERLKSLHPYNSVRLCLTENAEDPDRYNKIRNLLAEWKEKKVFETLNEPAFYLVEEKIQTNHGERKRIGFVGLLEVSPFSKKEVLPHEFTLSGPKKDRFDLLKTIRTEFSQVFFCYQDSKMILEKIYESCSKEKPFAAGKDTQGVARRMWLLSDKQQIKSLQDLISAQSVLIADGHHRYETAVNFHETEKSPETKYVQGYFTNLDSPGFSILPIHRLFSLPDSLSLKDFISKLKTVYELEEFSSGLNYDALTKAQNLNEVRLLFAAKDESKVFMLKHKKASDDDAEIFSIHKNIFEKILGWDVTKLAKGMIQYEHETEDFKKTLAKLPNGVGLFLPSTDLKLVMKLALRGERMPQKSTFFFPKLASGLVNYELGSY